MPVRLKVGEVYEADVVRSGESARGPWEMIVVRSKTKDKKEIAVFADNIPSGVTEGGTFKIDEILGVNYTARRREFQGVAKWEANINVDARVSPQVSYADAMEDLDSGYGGTPFSELKDTYGDIGDNPFGDDLPFNFGDDDRLPL